jgi:hypothetical protein
VHVLATLLLTLCLPSPQAALPLRPATDQRATTQSHPTGKWYLAETGHAVYCYGPVLLVKQPTGGLQRVATFCKGDQTMVPLKD